MKEKPSDPTDAKDVTRHSYDATAELYQAHSSKIPSEVKAERFLSFLPSNSKILDLGCGPGHDAKLFVEAGHKVLGVDLSPKMLTLAKASAPGAEFQVGDIENLRFPASSFDAVWASASLLHVSKQAMPNVFRKIHEILKPGGILYVSMKKGTGQGVEGDPRYGGTQKFWNYVLEEELIALLTGQGFNIREQKTYKESTPYQTRPWIAIICSKEA